MKSMKTLKLTVVLIGLAILSACNQGKLEELEAENLKLKELTTTKDSSINKMLLSFNEIQTNLAEIKKREGVIQINTAESNAITKDIKQSINEDIELINSLMQRNEELIIQLNQELESSEVKMDQFRALIANLNQNVKDKNQEIAQLSYQLREKKIKIGQLYYALDSLNFIYEVAEAELEQKIDQLNEAYYAYGTYKELKEKNVLTKEGGVLGLGKIEELKNNFNKEYFSRIDIRKQKSFLIYSKKAELVTNHPTGSYKFMGGKGKVDSLVITNVDDFWRSTKYLVIVVD